MKKHILISILILFLAPALYSQAPQSIPYQAVVRNTDGSVMADASITITFKIHDNTATGTVVYEENHTATTNTQGLISLNVGNGAVVSGTFSGINWGSGSKFLHVLMNAGGGVVDLGTQQMMSVPYALYAEDVKVRVSVTGDSLFIGNEALIVPGISTSNDNSIFTFGNGVFDVDGNFYNTVVLGTQEWMAENLIVKRYNNLDSIPFIYDGYAYYTSTFGTASYVGGDSLLPSSFGLLYNHYAVVDQRHLCPTNWHVPSDQEWETLSFYLDPSSILNNVVGIGVQSSIAGGMLKPVSSEFFNWGNVGGTNSSGLSLMPSGIRGYYGNYYGAYDSGFYWTSTVFNSVHAYYRGISGADANLSRGRTSGIDSRTTGGSVRCIKD